MTIAQEKGITEFPFIIKNEDGKEIYHETKDGQWVKKQYNSYGYTSRLDKSDGFWYTSIDSEFGSYFLNSRGYWCKTVHQDNGKTLFTDSLGSTFTMLPLPNKKQK
jgi:hypothetical protein